MKLSCRVLCGASYLSGRRVKDSAGVKTGGSGRPPPGAGKIPHYYADEEPDSDIAQCPEVGTVSQGETVEEAVANLREATELYLGEAPHFWREARAPADACTDFPLEERKKPIITTFEVAGGARV